LEIIFIFHKFVIEERTQNDESMIPDATSRKEDEYGEQIHTKAVKAGRRTYFFDVRATRSDDYFLTITESRKRVDADGKVSYDRHKIFLYKEDFAKFADSLTETIDFIRTRKPELFVREPAAEQAH